MLQVIAHGPVSELRMATRLFGRGVYWVSAFHFEGLLIDAGPPRTARELATWIRQRPLEAAVNTDHHEDHVGGDSALPIIPCAPAASLERMAHPERIQLFRRLVWGQARPIRARPLDSTIETGDLRLHVIPTPGHSDDHVVFLAPDRGWVFSGDLFIHERIRYAQADEDVLQSLTSMRRLLGYDFDELYCGHAGRVHPGKEALRRKIQFLEDVQGRALELWRQGLEELAIVRRIFGELGRWHWITGGWFSELNLIRQLMKGEDAT
ncbi:MAG: MBL fold metallo-hydrolase [Chloroflexota bacterium]